MPMRNEGVPLSSSCKSVEARGDIVTLGRRNAGTERRAWEVNFSLGVPFRALCSGFREGT